jgi:hypothetical protein
MKTAANRKGTIISDAATPATQAIPMAKNAPPGRAIQEAANRNAAAR